MIRRPLAAAALALCGVGAAACGGAEVSGAEVSGTRASAPASAPQIGQPTAATAGDSAGDTAGGTAGDAAEPATLPLAGRTVVIDPGHNPGNYRHAREINKQVDILTQKKACDTTGTSTNDGYTEAEFTWEVSKRLKRLLEEQGAKVVLTRTKDTAYGPCIDERAKIGNEARADAAISIHADGAPPSAEGFHVIMPKSVPGLPVTPVADESGELGEKIRDAFRSGTGLRYSTYIGRDALDYRSDLGGLNLSEVPKVFIECGNMRNAEEARKFKNGKFRRTIAESLAQGLRAYLTAAR